VVARISSASTRLAAKGSSIEQHAKVQMPLRSIVELLEQKVTRAKIAPGYSFSMAGNYITLYPGFKRCASITLGRFSILVKIRL